MSTPDAVVVGSGPNGLAAAVTLARAGLCVEVWEGSSTPGGGCRTAELTLAGFAHDVCSIVHPLLVVSPFFRQFDLEAAGVRLLEPRVAFAHPLDGGRAAAVYRSVTETAAGLGADGRHYRGLIGPLGRHAGQVTDYALSPLRSLPRHPVAVGRFGWSGAKSARRLAAGFVSEEARGLLAGAAAHSMRSLSSPLTGAYGLLLMVTAHAAGWPVIQGGSGRITDALVAELEKAGGRVVTGRRVASLGELPPGAVALLDLTARQLLKIAGDRLPARYRRAMQRYRYGPGVCKVDFALSGPVPWSAPVCHETATLHLGGSLEEVARSEADAVAGRHSERPFVIAVQPGVVDPTRAPAGRHTLWAYCHVPSGSGVDMTGRIEQQIERFAPGFRDLILAKATSTAAAEEAMNPNYVGGDINGGEASLRQTFARPALRWNPYRTPIPRTYLCSSSTPPGGGVHGMCGLHAARWALRDWFGITSGPPAR